MTTNIIGCVLLNRYRVDAFIASTPMSVVYRVWDQDRNVPLAMKVLHANLAEDPFIIDLLKREANALKKLKHPNIVLFYGLHKTEDFAFLLEAFVDGPTLKSKLRQRKNQPTPILEALTYFKALSAALGYAHVHQVVHCDVKPGNVMVDRGGSIYLTDFGIVRHADSTVTKLDGAGSPAYMAPEQIRGEQVSPATDVYGLGVLLFELLTGQRPFRGAEIDPETGGSSTRERVMYAHLRLPPPDPRSVNPSIPADLAGVMMKALAKAPRERYQSAPEFIDAVCTALGIGFNEVPDRLPLSSLPPKPRVEEKDPDPPPQPRRWIGLAISVAGAVSFILLLVFIFRPKFIFQNGTVSPEMETAVITGAGQSPLVEVIPSNTMTATAFATPNQTSTPTNTQKPPTRTPRLPTRTSRPSNPKFTARVTMYCRDGPGTNYEDHTMVNAGKTVPVLATWTHNDWLLVGINREDTRTKCCWVGGEGDINVSISSIRQIDFLPDRIKCSLSP